MKRILSLFLAVLIFTLGMPVMVGAQQAQEFLYQVENGQATITGYQGSATQVEIPSEIDGVPVIAIGGYAFAHGSLQSVTLEEGIETIKSCAFAYCPSLKTVHLPNSIKTLGYGAFERCTKLETLVLPDGLESIGESAFAECEALQQVVIPKSVTSIRNLAFWACSSLKEILVAEENQQYASQNGVLLDKEKTTLIWYPSQKENEIYQIPQGVKEIGFRAFEGTLVQKIIIPDSVEIIGSRAFEQSNITEVTIPGSVKEVGFSLFDSCKNLVKATIESGVTAIGSHMFAWCTSLTQVSIPQSVTSIGEQAFVNCEGLSTIQLPDSLSYIGRSILCGTAYYNNHENWYKNSLYIGPYCLEANVEEESREICFRNETRLIADNALSSCTQPVLVYIPAKVQWLTPQAFEGCPVISFTVAANNYWYKSDNGVLFDFEKEILLRYPAGKTSRTEYTLPAGVKVIGEEAFNNISSLRTVNFPLSLEEIGKNAFARCSALSTVSLPESVKKIGDFAFSNCHQLTLVTILGVESIGEGAFQCTKDCADEPSCDHIVLRGYAGSLVEEYSQSKRITFLALGEELPLGDLNNDQAVDAKDALMVLKIAVEKEIPYAAQKVAGDVTKDGNINAKDALEILKKAVGLSASF